MKQQYRRTKRQRDLLDIKTFPEALSIPPHVRDSHRTQFIKRASEFFVSGNKTRIDDTS